MIENINIYFFYISSIDHYLFMYKQNLFYRRKLYERIMQNFDMNETLRITSSRFKFKRSFFVVRREGVDIFRYSFGSIKGNEIER